MLHREDLLNKLVEKGVATSDKLLEVVKAAKEENVDIEKKILESGIITEENLVKIKADIYSLPYIDLNKTNVSVKVLNIISKNVSENYRIVCFDQDAGVIKIGITDPDNFKSIEAVDYLAKGQKLQVKYYCISNKSFLNVFKQYSSLSEELSSALAKKKSESEVLSFKEEEEEMSADVIESAPVIRIVSVIIRHAIEGGASDIHIEPMVKETRVRYRIDGILHTSLVLPKSIHDAIVARVKVMANLKLDETRIPQDGRIRLMIDEKEYDFRVSILPLMNKEKVVMRVLDTSRGAPTLEELGYEGEQYKLIIEGTEKTEGMIVVTGPTGSGKSTTLFSILNIVNKDGVNIATLEDPVEYQIKGINQSQVRPEIGYTFASGLRSFLRQDPDIIMVGEIRDQETGELAIHAAMTGHLVFSTIHTLDAIGTIARLVDMGIEPFLLGATLRVVIAQRLVRKICAKCKEKIIIPDAYMTEMKNELRAMDGDYIRSLVSDYDEDKLIFFKGKGCAHCGHTGYMGRAAISEVLFVGDELKELIVGGKERLTIEEVRKFQRFISIKQDGIIKVLKGLTTIDEVLRVMRD